jgi:hypothetical protein
VPFTHDLFLSYAHVDDRSLDDSEGWVTSLYQRLMTQLYQSLGREPKIWWDQRKQENKYVVDKIGDEISDTLLLTAILTPTYANSNWCKGELKEFCERAVQTGGLEIEGFARIFCAVKTPVEANQIPKELRMLERFEFYKTDANGRVTEFRHQKNVYDQDYWSKFYDLAAAIKKTLEKLGPQPDDALEPVDLPLSKKVYLAETSSDVAEAHDRVKRELLEQGYYVLPRTPLPLNLPDLESTARDRLSRCSLSIHIIGERYGVIPEGEEPKDDQPRRSTARLQLELATERAANDRSFKQLVWMPVGVQGVSGDQKKFIEYLQTNFGAELLQSSVDDLRNRVIEKLRPKEPLIVTQSDRKRVYLICDDRDIDDVVPIADYLGKGFEVVPLTDQSDSGQLAQYHRDNLVRCDGALIYYGWGNQLWLRLKMSDLLKASQWRDQRPLSKAIYVSGPKTPEKRLFRTQEAHVIENFGAFSPDVLQPFISALNANNGGPK